jgi:hypothetical protein
MTALPERLRALLASRRRPSEPTRPPAIVLPDVALPSHTVPQEH